MEKTLKHHKLPELSGGGGEVIKRGCGPEHRNQNHLLCSSLTKYFQQTRVRCKAFNDDA